ncbi:MAG: arsenical pump rane protein [Firmicutes bacterium]|nr:arsenical pump rane protein [Bacillota bacterium]
MWQAGILLVFVLVVFSIGKSPVFRVDRAGAAIIAAALMVACGVLTFDEAVKCIDFRTIVILFFMMIVIANLKVAGFFELMGWFLARSVGSPKQLLLVTVGMSGALSAFCINDIVCLLFTPVVLLVAKRAGCNPLPHLLGTAIASNVGSAATLLGNPQNILIASLSGVSFVNYFLRAFPVSVIGLLVSYFIISFVYRKELAGFLSTHECAKVCIHKYLVYKSLFVLALVILGYIAGVDLALTSSLGAAFLLVTRRVEPNKIYTSIDFNLLIIFIGLFIVVGGLEQSGLMRAVVLQTENYVNFQHKTVFAAVTIVLSNLVSNVPAVMLLKYFLPPVDNMQWWTALGVFSTFAGNLTITGSIANLIVVEIAKRNNITIGFFDYLKAGLPVTLVTSLVAFYLLS